MRRAIVCVIALLVVIGASCSSDERSDAPDGIDNDPSASAPRGLAAPVTASALGDGFRGDTAATALAGGRAVVVAADGQRIRGWYWDGAVFVEAAIESPELIDGTDLVVTGTAAGGFVAAGNRWDSTHIWVSPDGQQWSSMPAVGLHEARSITSIAEIADGLMVAGSVPAAGARTGMAGAVWTSSDGGANWQRLAEVSEQMLDATITEISSQPSGLVLVGTQLASTAIWGDQPGGGDLRRTDGDPELSVNVRGYDAIARRGPDVVAVGSVTRGSFDGSEPTTVDLEVAFSSDGGATWSVPATPASLEGRLQRGGHATATDEHYWVFGPRPEMIDDAACYAPEQQCVEPAGTSVFRSADAQTWERVSAAAFGLSEGDQVVSISGDEAGTLLLAVLGDELRAVVVRGKEVEFEPVVERRAPEPVVDIIPWSSPLPIGQTFGRPIPQHSGFAVFGDLDGGAWRLVDYDCNPDGTRLQPPFRDLELPIFGDLLYGTVTRTEDDLIEYGLIDGTVIAEYERGTLADAECE